MGPTEPFVCVGIELLHNTEASCCTLKKKTQRPDIGATKLSVLAQNYPTTLKSLRRGQKPAIEAENLC